MNSTPKEGHMMNVEVKEEVLMAKLRTENPEFKKWEQEHEKLEASLTTFESHRYLTPEEEVERKRIQKLKLAAKDRMMEIVRRSKVGQA
jgi:uncharacterized protein YdcH (DUF465 family)